MQTDLPNIAVKSQRTADPSRTLMLSFRFRSGACTALDYSHLYRVDYDGKAEIRLHFTQDVVTLRGQNLQVLYPLLLMHEPRELQAEDLLHFTDATAEYRIIEITIEQPCPISASIV